MAIVLSVAAIIKRGMDSLCILNGYTILCSCNYKDRWDKSDEPSLSFVYACSMCTRF